MASGGETQNIAEGINEEEEVDELPKPQKITFGAACAIMLSGFMGFGSNFTAGNMAVSWNLLLMFSLGLLFAFLDPPVPTESAFVAQLDMVISKHIKILTTITGKGLCIMIIGCALNDTMTAANSPAILPKLLNYFIIFAGLMTAAMGYMKTRKLSAAREAILGSAPPGYVESQVENVLQPFAHVYSIALGAQAGLTPDEFNQLVTTIGHSEPFDPTDMKLVFKQLRQDKKVAVKGGKSFANAKNLPPKLLVSDMQAWFENKSATVLL